VSAQDPADVRALEVLGFIRYFMAFNCKKILFETRKEREEE
jgi:hypothetical protein